MTPAVALSQAALEPSVAYAAGEVVSDNTKDQAAVLTYTTRDIPASVTAPADKPANGWSDVSLTPPPGTTSFVYNGSDQAPAKGTAVAYAKYTYYTGSTGSEIQHEKWFKVTGNDDIAVTYTKDGSPATPNAAGNYTAAYKVSETNKGSDPGRKNSWYAAVDAINGAFTAAAANPINTQPFSITKAPATATAPTSAVVNVDSWKSVCDKVKVMAGQTNLIGNYDVKVFKKGGAEETGAAADSNKISTAGAYTIKVTSKTTPAAAAAAAANYAIEGAVSGTWSQDITVGVSTEGLYTASWETPGVTAKPASGSKTSATAKYVGDGSPLGVDTDIACTYQSGVPGESPVALADGDFGITWYDAEDKAVTSGTPAAASQPMNPGVYTAVVMPKSAPEGMDPAGELTLTVQADLGTQVNRTKTEGEGGSPKPIDLMVNGYYPEEVQIANTGNMTEDQVASQIMKGMTLEYKGTPVKNPGDLFDYKVVLPNSTNPNGGTVVLTNKTGAPQIFTGGLTIKYTFGAALPAVKDFAPVYYSVDGWDVNDLVAFDLKTTDTEPESGDYTVTVYKQDGTEFAMTGTDFPTDAGTYSVMVAPAAGKNFVGEPQNLTFTINPLPVTDKNGTYTWNGKYLKNGTFSMGYTGQPLVPTVGLEVQFKPQTGSQVPSEGRKVTLDNIVSKYQYDHATDQQRATYNGYVECENNVNVGTNTAVAKVTLVGNYSGGTTQNFSITTASLQNAPAWATNQLAGTFPENPTVADIVDPVVEVDGHELTLGTDYEIVSLTKGKTANGVTPYTFAVRGKGAYTGETTGSFKVTTKNIADEHVAVLDNPNELFFYDTDKHEPVVKVGEKPAAGSTTLVNLLTLNRDYKVKWKNNVNAGTATAVVTGAGDYAGELTVDFEIQPLLLDGASADKIKLGGADDLVYSGKAYEPEVLYNKSTVLPANVGYGSTPIALDQYVDDLTYTYENNTNASTAEAPAYVVISGKTGNFKGSVKVPFTIAQADIAKATIEAAAVAPGASVADAVVATFGDATLAAGTDYTVEAKGNVPGTVAATIAGTGNFTGEVEKDLSVLYDVAKANVAVANSVYTGSAQTPKVEVSYMADGKKVVVDPSAYDVKVAGNATDAGTYKVTVTGKAAAGWTGSVEKSFTISKAAGPKTAKVTYTDAGAPVVTIPGLTEGKDFKVTPNPAQKKLVITYTGNYTGSTTVNYKPVGGTDAPVTPGTAGKTGWVGSGNDWAYYENGKAVKGQWKWIGDAWYHFEKSGKMTNTKWFQDADGTWYMLNQSHKGHYGAMLTGWQKVGKDWYYMNKSGAMQSGWAKVKGEWYLLNTSHDGTFGKMLTGWQQVGGKWYYMDASGAMASNEWVGRYWVNGSGVWTATR